MSEVNISEGNVPMAESEATQTDLDRLLAKIMSCDLAQQRRLTFVMAALFALVGFGFTLAGLILPDFLFLTIGLVEILVGAIFCVGRVHILSTYELVQNLMKNASGAAEENHESNE